MARKCKVDRKKKKHDVSSGSMQPAQFTPGDEVLYIPMHANRDPTHPDCEKGVVTSTNDHYVFVRYGNQANSKATRAEDLVFPNNNNAAFRPDYTKRCICCGATPVVPCTEMCGPCSFGEASTVGGSW